MSPQLTPHLKDDATITLDLDQDFTGVMHGYANDEADGCSVKGNCVVDVHRTIKVRRLVVWLEGRCKVHLKSNTYSVATPEATEARSLYSRSLPFIGEDAQTHTLTPGQYIYPFEFELPSNLPASFRGKHGYIRYRLAAAIYKTGMFSTDISLFKDITIKRCLLNDVTPIADMVDTVHGRRHLNKLQHYNATAPRLAYREGGLVRLHVAMQLANPTTQSVQSVTCALRERVQCRTTNQQGRTSQSKTEDLYPLGYSAFHPDQAPDYDPAKSQEYDAVFRLIPRVNADTNSKLVRVTHSLVVNIMVHDKDKQANPSSTSDSVADSATDRDEAEESGGSLFTDSSSEENQDDKFEHPVSPLSTPPTSRPTSPVLQPSIPPTLSRTSSSSSLTSIFSLRRSHQSENKQKASSSDLTLCTLEIPLVVTSRENVWEGEMPKPPSYESTNTPPSYDQTIDVLPPVPTYASDQTPANAPAPTPTPTTSAPATPAATPALSSPV